MLPSPLASLSCFHYLADKQSKNARSTTEKPVRHGRTAGVCLTKRERPESRNAGPRESSLKTLHDENGSRNAGSLFEAQVVRQRLESERIQAFVLNENSNDYVPFAGAIPSLAVQGRRSRRRLREGPRPVGRRNGLGATDSLSRMRVAGRAFGSGRNPSETFRRLSARRPRRIGERLGRQHPPVFPVQPVRNAVPLAHSARPTENGFQLHARNARQSAEGLLGFFLRSDVPVRGCVPDAWPEAPGRCEKPAETTARHRLIRNSDYLAFTTKRCRSATGESPTRFRTAPRRIPRFRTPISKRASK